MRLQGRDLRAGLFGEDVATLQDELARLGYAIPGAERSERMFGVGTAQAVAAFQTAHRLLDTAVVDKNTAAVLERAAADLPTTIMPPVRQPPEPPARPPAQPPEAPSPAQPVAPPVGTAPVPPAGTPEPAAEEPPAAEAPPAAAGRLAGRLFADRGTPATGVTLRVYTRGFGGKATLVGEAVTGPDGEYTLDQELPAGTARLDVRAVGADGAEIPLVPPDRRIDVDRPVDLVAPADRLPAPEVEYARLGADLRPHLNGGSLADAKEDDEQRDLTLLHEATGWDARLIALAASAERLAARTGVAAEVAYALGRVGLPTDPVQLARVGPAGVGHGLRKAVEAGVVALDDAQIEAAQSTLDDYGRRTRRKLAIAGTASSYGAMLAATGLSSDQQDTFDTIFSAHTRDAESLWQQAGQAGLPADQLKLTAQLGVLTLNNARLTESLRGQAGSPEQLGATLVADQLYQPESWQARLRTLANGNDRVLAALVPSLYPGETVDERLQVYAADLAHKVRRSYPALVLRDRVGAGQLPLAGADPTVAGDLATVLDRAAADGFVPGQQPLRRYLADRGEQLFAGLSTARAEAATAELATLYRQYQISASDEGMAALQRAGLRSAQQISGMPQRVFLARFGEEFPTRAEAALTWHRAQQVSAVTLNLVATAKQLDSLRLLPAMALPHDLVAQAQQELVRQFPTLESLFGSMDFCQCRHCRSVLSPAAYLVDLLKLLDDAPGEPSPYQALTQRRPDLPHLPLTCENTNTALPYIDVVNEILEFFLAHDQLTPQAAYDTGTASSADLLAEPQNLLPAAYDTLREARYPQAAPFDLWLATVRAFTGYFEVPFWTLLEALRPTDELHPAAGEDGYGRAAVGYERLGFATAELAILTDTNPLAAWWRLFGYDADPGAELANARTLSRRLQVSYHELVALLRTRFANPAQALVLVDQPPEGEEADPCSWEHMTLRRAGGQDPSPMDYLLLAYLVRVWRRLGWPLAEVDEALVTFLPTDPDPRTGAAIGPAMATALLRLSHLDRLVDTLDAGAAGRRDLLVLWGPLSDARYQELFLTGTAQTRDPVFEGEPGSYLTDPAVLLAEHREGVQAALQLTADEVRAILTDAGLDPPAAPLTMATVSLLHRYGLLARLLKVSVDELVEVKELAGLDPFTPLGTGPVSQAADDHAYQQTIRFVETVQALAGAGLSMSEVDFLLRHRFDPVGPHRDAAAPPLALARTLAGEIARIRSEHAEPADPLTFTDEQVARSLGLVLDPAVMTAFLDAWTGAAALPDEIFDEHLRRRVIPGVGEVGFLAEADRDVLFTPTPDDQAADAQRRARLATAFLPYLRNRLVAALVTETVATERAADPALVAALLTNPDRLADPEHAGQPLVAGYAGVGERGLTVTDGEVSGYLEVPASGGYRFAAHCEAAGTRVTLRFDHLSEASLSATATAADLAPATEVELQAGVPYGFTLTHTAGAGVALRVRSQRLPTTPVTELVTYSRAAVARLHRTHLLLAKVLRLVAVLGLTEPELRHLLAHRDDFGGLDLGALPTEPGAASDPPEPARVRFAWLLRLVGYARLRGELAADPGDLVAVFAHARRRLAEGDDPVGAGELVLAEVAGRIAAITRREPPTVRAAAELLGIAAVVDGDQVTVPELTQERGLARLWRVLSLVARLRVDPAALGRWATPTPDHTVARDVRDTVKATYPVAQWRRVAQPIFDRLRQQRRDALVAQVLRVTGYERPEQLFEHFLVDPMTEPVVQTSRLQLAIASVQTFIQRCLLNLEQDVAPSAINAEHWAWMKRYRFWEVNRKIFLWPENWLEPEFRDDKTHLFAALERELLDSDLDEDAVEAALFGYLSGLEEVARLDVRATHWQQRPGGDVLHVVARTPTAPHRYFYRTWSHRSWTPWVPVTADIEGDHLAIAVWQGRLHLFWATFLVQAEQEASPGSEISDKPAGELKIGEMMDLGPNRTLQAQLFWSSYAQGEWSQPQLAEPEEQQEIALTLPFRPWQIFIWARVESDREVSVTLLGQVQRSFRLTSRHAPPQVTAVVQRPETAYRTEDDMPLVRRAPGRWRGTPPTLSVRVQGETSTDEGTVPCDQTWPILQQVPHPYWLVLPAGRVPPGKLKAKSAPEDPFFYLDREHTFFVEPDWAEWTIGQADQAIVAQNPVWTDFELAEFWQPVSVVAAVPVRTGGLPRPPDELITRPDDVITRPDVVVPLGGGLVGPAGGLAARPAAGELFRSRPHGALARSSEPTGLSGPSDLSERSSRS